MAWLYGHLNGAALSGSVLEVEESSRYQDLLRACREGDSVLVRASYTKELAISNFKYVSGSMPLYERIVSAIKAYYALA